MADDSGSNDTDAQPNDETRAEEVREANADIDAGRGPTPDEEAAADRSKNAAEGVEEPYREMTERGANVKGEGQVG